MAYASVEDTINFLAGAITADTLLSEHLTAYKAVLPEDQQATIDEDIAALTALIASATTLHATLVAQQAAQTDGTFLFPTDTEMASLLRTNKDGSVTAVPLSEIKTGDTFQVNPFAPLVVAQSDADKTSVYVKNAS